LLSDADGYGLSKWAAEQLACRAATQAALPVLVARLGNLGWSTATGVGNSRDFQGSLLRGAQRLGVAPNTTWHLELTPVDVCAEALLAHASAFLDAWGRQPQPQTPTAATVVHVSDPAPTRWEDAVRLLADAGAPGVAMVPWDTFCAAARAAAADAAWQPNQVLALSSLPGSEDQDHENAAWVLMAVLDALPEAYLSTQPLMANTPWRKPLPPLELAAGESGGSVNLAYLKIFMQRLH
jgi:hypothetical protein